MTPSTALDQNEPSILTKIDRRSLKGAAVDQIRTAILRGELKPGERITELGLAKTLGVGQATIREALIELEHQGFIQRGTPRKTYVTALSQQDIKEMYLVRIRLELLAVELLAAEKGKDLSECERAFQGMEEAARKGKVPEFIQEDLNFHRKLWQSAGNRSLVDLLERLVPRLFAFFIIRSPDPSRQSMLEGARQHGHLLQLLKEGKEKEAKVVMQESMQQARSEDLRISRRNSHSSKRL